MKSAKLLVDKLEDSHPFLADPDHRIMIIKAVKKFVNKNFGVNIDLIKIGHLFFGQKAFPIPGRDIGFVYSDKAKYYLTDFEFPINNGPIILIDETTSSYNIIIAEISSDDLGHFFEDIIINIIIKKNGNKDYGCFVGQDYSVALFKINNYGTLSRLGSHNFEIIINNCSAFIRQLFIFNLEKF